MTNETPDQTEDSNAAKAQFAALEAEREAGADNTPPPPPRTPLKPEQKWSLRIALFLAVLCPVFFMTAALGTKFGLWDYRVGLVQMSIGWGPKLLMLSAAVAALTVILCLIRSPRRGVILAIIALLIPGFLLGRMMGQGEMVNALPPIHDVQTDWSRPLELPEALIALRKSNGWNPALEDPVVSPAAQGNWPQFVGKRVADLQAEAYPDIKPLLIEAPLM